MEHSRAPIEHRKRKRRRVQRQPLSAKLLLDDQGKGDVGTISHELFVDLFPASPKVSNQVNEEIYYIAISPWRPPSTNCLEDATWTILPVRPQTVEPTATSVLKVPASSLILQRFSATVHGSQYNMRSKSGFEILMLDVQPLSLETLFIRIDGDVLRKHEEVQKKFGGGFTRSISNTHGGKNHGFGKIGQGRGASEHESVSKAKSQESSLREAIRSSLVAPLVVHQGDLLPLPLPAHPITHVPFPPMKIMACEPVDQGLVSGRTKIVIDMTSRHQTNIYHPAISKAADLLKSAVRDDGEDASSEQFFSAVESGEPTPHLWANGSRSTASYETTSDSSDSEGGTLSDDSPDDIISLASPTLPLQASGIMSSMTAATPRAMYTRANGINSPGSVYSNFTSTTAQQSNQALERPFQVKPLVTKVPDSILHPQPSSDEDDEARVFVDVKMLVRLGCFSGDWVKVSTPQKHTPIKEGFWLEGAFEDGETEPSELRVLRIYGLADPSTSSRSVGSLRDDANSRIPHHPLSRPSKPVPNAYISPMLFANLGQPATITMSPLLPKAQGSRKFTKSKVKNSSIPPIAKEVTLLRLPTPLSTERAVQGGLLAGLKQYFEKRRRILRTGDLIGIRINVGVSRILSEAAPGNEPDNETEELYHDSQVEDAAKKPIYGVAWFKVGQIQQSQSSEDQAATDPEIWAGNASTEPMTTRMVQVGVEQGMIPPTNDNPWEFYLGLKTPPRSQLTNAAGLVSLDSLPGQHLIPLRRRMRELLAAATSPQALRLEMKPVVLLLHSTQRNTGKAHLATQACADLGLHVFHLDTYDILTDGGAGSGDVKTEASLRARIDRALTCGAEYTVPLIRHAEALTADRIASALKEVIHDLRVLILTTTELEKIPEGIRSLLTHELEVKAPDEQEREGILKDVIHDRGIKLAYDVDIVAIAVKTAALVAGDLIDVVERAQVARQERLEKLSVSFSETASEVFIRDLLISGGGATQSITNADFNLAVEAARRNFADSIGAPKIPNVSWDDVGGLSNVKDAVMETIQLPLERPELFAKGMKKRSGILFYGPPGTGKTLLAKAIATEFSLNFFSVKGPELLNMYIGESEANVRRVFQRARDARPCVVFFDELDSVAPKRGNQGDSGGVMDRIVSQLLAELDGMSNGDGGAGGVFVIGATNRPDLLDQALLRPGRFDKMLYLGVSDTHDKQLTILEALTRKFTLHPDVSLRRVSETLPFTYTGADLYALCSDAMLKGITRQASAVDTKIKALPGGPVTPAYYFDHFATTDDIAVLVTEQDFFAAQRELVPSVSAKELEHYQRVRKTFEAPEQTDKSAFTSHMSLQDSSKPRTVGTTNEISLRPKYKTRTTIKPKDNGKGKGKAPQWKSEDEDEDEDDDDAYVTSNDYGTPARSTNGRLVSGEALHGSNGFRETAANDDEDLYE